MIAIKSMTALQFVLDGIYRFRREHGRDPAYIVLSPASFTEVVCDRDARKWIDPRGLGKRKRDEIWHVPIIVGYSTTPHFIDQDGKRVEL